MQRKWPLRLTSAFPQIRDYDLASFLSGLLTYHPDKRLTPWEALQHPFMAPEICIPYFLSDATKDAGLISKQDYNSSHVHCRYPPTSNLLRRGASDTPVIEYTNIALVESVDLVSRPEKDVASQQKYYNRSPIMQRKVAASILPSKKTTAGRRGKRISLPSKMTRAQRTGIYDSSSKITSGRKEKRISLHSEIITQRTDICDSSSSKMTAAGRKERCISLPSEMATTKRTDICDSSFSKMTGAHRIDIYGSSSTLMTTACETETCVSSEKNTRDTHRSFNRELLYHRNPSMQKSNQSSVSGHGTFSLTENVETNHVNLPFNRQESKPHQEELGIKQSQKVNSSCKNMSEFKTDLQSARHSEKLTGLENEIRDSESLFFHKASLVKANVESCHLQESLLPETDHCCRIFEGAKANAYAEKSGMYTRLKAGGANTKKSVCARTLACLKLDRTPNMDSTNGRDNNSLKTSASLPGRHLTVKSIKHKSFLGNKQNRSRDFSKFVKREMGSQTLPLKGYPISHNMLASQAPGLLSACLSENVSDTSVALQKYLTVKHFCHKKPQQDCRDDVIQKPACETVCVETEVDCSIGNQLTHFSEISKSGDERHQQIYLRHQTLHEFILSNPDRGKDKESWQPQLKTAAIIKPDKSTEKSHMAESDNCFDNCNGNSACATAGKETMRPFSVSGNCNVNSASTCATAGKEDVRYFSVSNNCNKLTLASKRKSENKDTPNKELVLRPLKAINSVELPCSKTQKMQSKTRRQRLTGKVQSDCRYIEDVHHGINGLISHADITIRQPHRRNLVQTGLPKECTESPFIHKNSARSKAWMSGTLKTVSTQYRGGVDCSVSCHTLEPESSLLKPSPLGTENEISEDSTDSDTVDYRKHSSLNGSFQIKPPLRLKRKCSKETGHFNQTDASFHKNRSQNKLTDSLSTEKENKSKKLKTEMPQPNNQARSQEVQEKLFHTQKNSRTLQINNTTNHEMKTTQFKEDVRKIGNILNTSGVSKSRIAKKSTIFQRDNPVFKREKSCFTNRSVNNVPAAEERTFREKHSDTSRLFRAKAVKKALSFSSRRSLQITNNGNFTVTNKKAEGTFDFPTSPLKTDNGWTSYGKENDCFKLSYNQTVERNTRTNRKGMQISLPGDYFNLSDPYEFKVSPAKPQEKITVNNQKQSKSACQRRTKLRCQGNKKRNKRLAPAAESGVSSAISLSIRDLVEQKTKYLFQDNKVLPEVTTIHDHQQKCEKNNEKQLQSGVQVNVNQCATRKTEFPGGEKDALSKNTSMKTLPFQGHELREAFQNLPMSGQDESKSANSSFSSSQETALIKVPVPKNNMTDDKKDSQSVPSVEANTALREFCFGKQFEENNDTDKLSVGCTLFPHRRMDDHNLSGHDSSTVDFKQNFKFVPGNINDEESSTDEEVLLLD